MSHIFTGEMDQRSALVSTPTVNQQQRAVQVLKWPSQTATLRHMEMQCSVITGSSL